jgi:hydroxymethylglutaryl-CoA reductase (NADPH)
MPWKECSVMNERLRFVARLLDGEAMSEVCREFGVSRKTGYKIFERYKEHGLEALSDRSRRPIRYANQLPPQIESLIVRCKQDKPHWGARKIRELLVRRLDGDFRVPAKSTIHAVLHRHGLVKGIGRPRRRAEGVPLSQGIAPNDLWCADFKGEYLIAVKDHREIPDTRPPHAAKVVEDYIRSCGVPSNSVSSRRFLSPSTMSSVARLSTVDKRKALANWENGRRARGPRGPRLTYLLGFDMSASIPRNDDDDYTSEAAKERRTFLQVQTGVKLTHVSQHSFSPSILRGNIENFIGVAQVPIGAAGPLRINGEHAKGEFLVPLATTEGTLVASYNRGMRLLTECGGVMTTVVEQQMQRCPVFIFDDARQAREFGVWIDENFAAIKMAAEATTRTGKLKRIYQYAIGPARHLRFNYTTGDAAGQNMTGKATDAACRWIQKNYTGGARYILSGNMDTDKKHSQINMLQTRGKRVVAEAVIKRDILKRLMRVDPEELFYWRQISASGAFLAGSANNGQHAANGLAALFIATGQDVANIAESHAGVVYSQLLPNGDYYWSTTLTSLIVATVGGGTHLATQRECLEMLGCYGSGKADKFAEICAGVVLAGETSLSCAVLAGDWVSSHERYGRNRPAE